MKLQRLQYLLYKALPVLRHIYAEQSSELEIEAKIKGGSCLISIKIEILLSHLFELF